MFGANTGSSMFGANTGGGMFGSNTGMGTTTGANLYEGETLYFRSGIFENRNYFG